MNNINKKIKFTIEHENNNKINFLDLTIHRQSNHLEFNIYRKPTTTDTTIHADSHHPIAHKLAAYNSYLYRLINTPLSPNDYTIELNTIKFIALQNGYSPNMIDQLLQKLIKTQNRPPRTTPGTRYISAEYTQIMPNILKRQMAKTNTQVCFRTSNTIQKQLAKKRKAPIEEKTGIYKLTCNDCDKFYIGQTGRKFKTRFKEHIPPKNITPNTKIKSNFCLHLIDNNHNYTSLEENMKPIHICTKGRYMNAREEYEIYRAFKYNQENILNEQLDFKSNQLYDTAIDLMKINKRENNKHENGHTPVLNETPYGTRATDKSREKE